ncbi:ABC transporter ATP-binding protein [Halobacillus locisalis]|uniref:ABC transporter ATP-binding protein n=1 Tax=Halobacillus locisalis TaxID=220753 RepID=A0A838CSJ6_9BACI|nr:ABC transporter ATP-binding protein [Halobacillus locisalis]MBA2174858.1 ABC transporter ATP-binding protein [Halobacillus locisalis]
MRNPILRTENLTVTYEEQQSPVLQDINILIEQGEAVLLLGPSGSGKSSLTHCLNGLFPRELDGSLTGNVYIDGQNTTDYQPGEIARKVGVVFQDPDTQFCMITVEDEIAFGLENLNIPHKAMVEKVDQALQWVGMTDHKLAKISDLSGGQKQKVALACILAMEPEVLILDEPTANLDPVATRDFIDLLKHLKQKLGFTLLVIEHKLEGWLTFLERVIVFSENGTINHDGPLHHHLQFHAAKLDTMGIRLPFATRTSLEEHRQPPHPLFVTDLPDPPSLQEETFLEKAKGDALVSMKHATWKSIIHDVDVTIHEGEWIAIAGENGSGKSSLSKILAGIQKPSSGTVFLKGRPLKKWAQQALRKEIGYVFQNPEHQFIADSVYDEVAFSLRHSGIAEEEQQTLVQETLAFCRLEGMEHQHPFLLSQGQKRRLSVATMIVDQQRLLFLDEPTFGQDERSTAELMALLEQKHDNGITIVMITHDMELVDRYADRVLVIKEGRLAFNDRPEKLWAHDNLASFHLELPPREQWKRTIKHKEQPYVST